MYFCLDVQGMGDLNAVDIAQQVHQSILERAQAIRPEHQVFYDSTVPASPIWQALYIDDFITSWVCPRRLRKQITGTPDAALVEAGLRA